LALSLVRKRPFIMTCSAAYEGDSSIANVPSSHYSAILTRNGPFKLSWKIGELPTDSRVPWPLSPELQFGGAPALRPHSGGYNMINGNGSHRC
jgi:hypothetical protein